MTSKDKREQRPSGWSTIDRDSLDLFLKKHSFRATDVDLTALLKLLESFTRVSTLRGEVGDSQTVLGNRRVAESSFKFQLD